jgi:hypothetical protein
MVDPDNDRIENKKGSMILYADFIATDRLYFNTLRKKLSLANRPDDDESFVGDKYRGDRVAVQCKEYKTKFYEARQAVTAYHAVRPLSPYYVHLSRSLTPSRQVHSKASAVMALHRGLKPGIREFWKWSAVFLERTMLGMYYERSWTWSI